MTVQEYKAELAFGPTATFGEGPLWDNREGIWWWTDIPASTIHRFDPRTNSDTTIPVGTNVGTLVLRSSGGLAAGTTDGFATIDAAGGVELIVPVNADDPAMRINDGKCDTAGRFYASTMAFTADIPCGELLRLDPDRSVHVEAEGLTIGNGMDWSADQSTFYFTDTMAMGIDAYDADPTTGSLSNCRRLFDIDPEHGLPDGFCIDDEGALWVAMWKGSGLRRYAPDGELLGVVPLPVSNVTCAAFGGANQDELLITTAAPTWSGLPDNEPLGGAVFRLFPGVSGPPPNSFAG